MDIPLHELNKHLFAAMLPKTHGEKPAQQAESREPLKTGVIKKVKASSEAD